MFSTFNYLNLFYDVPFLYLYISKLLISVQKDEKVEVMDKSAEVGASDSILSSNRSVHFKTPVEPLSVKKLRRRTVATASGCGRRTPRSASKSSRLSMSLRLLSPEER